MTIHIYLSLFRYTQKIQEICTQHLKKLFRTKWLQAKVVSVTSLGTKHILNSFGETFQKFSEVIFWYIIPGFIQYVPEFFFRFRLYFIFSVQVIPYCLYNIQVWTLWRPMHDCLFCQLLLDFLRALEEETLRNVLYDFERFHGRLVLFLSLTSPDSSNVFITV